MQYYRCLFYNTLGRTESTVLSASDEAELIRSFSESGKTLVSVEPVKARSTARGKSPRTQAAVLQFTEMMELLLDSGLTLKDAIDVAAGVGGKGGAGSLAERLNAQVKKGLPFSRAIESMPEAFPPIYLGMIRVGERIGSVERIFPRLAAYLRDRKALRDKIIGALAYPTLVLAVALLGSVGMAIFVLPKMEGIFAGFGGDASATIRSNMAAIKGFIGGISALIAVLAISFPAAHLVGKRNPSFRVSLERALIRAPLVGGFIASWETLSFAFAMETLAAGGVPVEDAIEEASLVVGNASYRDALIKVREELMKGGSLASAFSGHAVFPDYLKQWVAIGERSGKTERVFAQIRTYYQAEVDRRSQRLMTLVEPALIALIGVFLLIMVVGIVIPLFSMYGSML